MAKITGTPGKAVSGTSSNDTLEIRGATSGHGFGGNDTIYGDSAANCLAGGDGSDHIWGRAGNDALFGGNGLDQLYGEGGNDMIWGGAGNDYLSGGSGNDKLRGEDGNDTLHSGGGTNEDINGGAGNDTLIMYGRQSNPVIGGENYFKGEDGYDTLAFDIQGSYGPDSASMTGIFIGSDGTGSVQYAADTTEYTPVPAAQFSGIEEFRLLDGSQNMFLFSSANMKAVGGTGSDMFTLRSGDQVIDGGASGDTIRFQYSDQPDGIGHDTILNFQKGLDDVQTNGFTDDFDGSAVLTTYKTESDGNTTYTSVDNSGQVMHVVDFIGVTGLADDLLSSEYILG